MKNSDTLRLFLLCMMSAVFLFTSCKDDENLDREAFLGNYTVSEVCDNDSYSYNISIEVSDTDDETIVITNFGDYGVDVDATVSGDRFSFSDTPNDILFSGAGSFSGDNLVINYAATSGGAVVNCTMTCELQ